MPSSSAETLASSARVRYSVQVKYLLCQCNAVTEHEVVMCIRRGARCLDEVGDECLAGTGCGSCQGAIEALLKQEAQLRRASDAPEPRYQMPLFSAKHPSR